MVSEELDLPEFTHNPRNRCYYCKKELFSKLVDVAASEGLACVVDGSNLDDQSDHRPGSQAASELAVRSPLRDAGLTKADIRALSRWLELPTWDKPSFACLSSRFPYGTAITRERVGRVGTAERELRGLGFTQLRLRYHGDVGRLEVLSDQFGLLLEPSTAERVVAIVKEAGFTYVTFDLQGYRTGSMNEAPDVDLPTSRADPSRGGRMNRDDLQHLLEDVAAGRVDVNHACRAACLSSRTRSWATPTSTTTGPYGAATARPSSAQGRPWRRWSASPNGWWPTVTPTSLPRGPAPRCWPLWRPASTASA